MDPETGKIVVIAITSLVVIAWLAGFTTVLATSREIGQTSRIASERFDVDEGHNSASIGGGAEVDGQPDELLAKLASHLARDGIGPGLPVKIVSFDRLELTFEPVGLASSGFRLGRIRVMPAHSRSRVEYAIESSPRGLLIGAWIFVALGLVAVVAVPWLMFAYVLPSPTPNVRGQAFQAFQMVHLLWPPFLFAHLARQVGRMLRGRMDALIHNLPYS